MKAVRSLFEHYAAYHRHGPLMLRYAGLLGAIAFPALYFLRSGASRYDDFAIRMSAGALCLLLLLKDRWPARLKPWYLPFSYPALTFSLPFAFVFVALRNGGGTVGVASTLMAVFFMILVTDWRNTVAMLVLGIGAAVAAFVLLDPAPKIPWDYVARWPTFLIVVVGGTLFKLAGQQAAAERMRIAYASIAGSIAHEVRNPLAQIRQNLERMQNAMPAPGAGLEDPARIDALYAALAESELAVDRGLQLISMTLDEVAQKPLETSSFTHLSAAEVARKAVQEYSFEDELQRGRVSVRIERDFTFRADETAYLFVLFNLIKNALYSLGPYPEARLEIIVVGQQVKVRDDGPGIAPEVLSTLFQPFRTYGKAGGTGLGLAYCKRVMRAIGGDIVCESVPGQFTEFTMSFQPVSEQALEAHRTAVLGRARQAFEGRRLLVVDDDAALRTITRHKLVPLAATLDEAADGLHALAMLRQQRYDLVVLDLAMPGMDGYGLAEALHAGAAPLNRNVPLLAYTSEPSRIARVKTFKAGIAHFVSKPCEQLGLVQALLHALSQPVPARPGERLAGRHILVADDSAFNRKAVRAYLEEAGAAVTEAADGHAVLVALARMPLCDAILLDINMPGMNGLDTARALRDKASPWARLPLLALSAHSSPAIVSAARAAGMADFLIKPVEAAQLCRKLEALCAPREARSAALTAGPMAVTAGTLLDHKRLDDYRRMGLLDELVKDYVPEIARLVRQLETCALQQDLQGSLEALHSLVGLSGEAGAGALHRLARRFYIPMVEAGSWPPASGWVAELKSLAADTEQALAGCVAVSRGTA